MRIVDSFISPKCIWKKFIPVRWANSPPYGQARMIHDCNIFDINLVAFMYISHIYVNFDRPYKVAKSEIDHIPLTMRKIFVLGFMPSHFFLVEFSAFMTYQELHASNSNYSTHVICFPKCTHVKPQ